MRLALRGTLLLPQPFRAHFGPVASGDEDVIETEEEDFYTDPLAPWRLLGRARVARACAFSNVPFVEIRGVTDTANKMLTVMTRIWNSDGNVVKVIISSLDGALGSREVV
jgi:nucleoside phosphorylase